VGNSNHSFVEDYVAEKGCSLALILEHGFRSQAIADKEDESVSLLKKSLEFFSGLYLQMWINGLLLLASSHPRFNRDSTEKSIKSIKTHRFAATLSFLKSCNGSKSFTIIDLK
jgi:hypothetical protein